MPQKYIPILLILFSLFTIFYLWQYPTLTTILGMLILFLSLAFALHAIIQKHKQTENSRIKIAKDVLIFIATFLLISFLGGMAGLFTNFYVSDKFGITTGFICAMLAGIVVGYLVKKFIANAISFN
ncbi:MAG TPA: hypothetical protein DHW49_08395 [Anaerolineae bacterium]|nr:hypothetical protein [Anaerolineae bacterium]